MSAAGIPGRRKLTITCILSEPFVGRVLVGHQSQVRVRLHGDETSGENGGYVAVPATHFSKVL